MLVHVVSEHNYFKLHFICAFDTYPFFILFVSAAIVYIVMLSLKIISIISLQYVCMVFFLLLLLLVVFISLNFYLGQIVRLGRVCRIVLDKIFTIIIIISLVLLSYIVLFFIFLFVCFIFIFVILRSFSEENIFFKCDLKCSISKNYFSSNKL